MTSTDIATGSQEEANSNERFSRRLYAPRMLSEILCAVMRIHDGSTCQTALPA
jgi:hypothetical protein